MLAQMRALTRSFVAKILLGLLVVAFAIWGIQGAFSGIGSTDIAKVGVRGVSAAELDRTLRQVLENQREAGRSITREEAIRQEAHRRILEELIQEKAMYSFAEQLGVRADRTLVAQEIVREIPAARNPLTGAVDEAAFESFLRRIGYSRDEFFGLVRDRLAVQQAGQALTDGVRAPDSFGALLLAYQSEVRTVSVAQLPITQLPAIPAPTDAQLQELYRELSSRFAVPEFRNFTMVIADPVRFAAAADVSEERIREAFERQRERLSTPERRSFSVITADSEAEARAAAERLSRGEDAAAVAAAIGGQHVSYENQTAEEVGDEALAAAVFAMPAGAAPRAVSGSLTRFAAVRLISVTPGQAASLDAMREEIRAALARDAGRERIADAIEEFETLTDEGRPLAEAARGANLEVREIEAVSAEGRTPNGEAAPAPFSDARVLREVFAIDAGEDVAFMRIENDVEVFIHLNDIIPESTRPFAEVRPVLAQEWTRRERTARLEAVGRRIIEAVHAGGELPAAAAAERATMAARSETITRQEAARSIPEIFSAREGEVVMGVSGDGALLLVAQVEKIERDDPAQQRPIVERNRASFQRGPRSLGASLGEAIQAAAVEAANVRVNENLLDRTFNTQTTDE
ncbi:MAG: SurA N-terminal domain-containing protein [Hydrogenophilaceae bacterium]|jgi:peptidyl-prolyl cis-trans isomerase D|nr:SurA N-terminal domain-containing protein [Hydrogenophilaceae bacterium]